MADLLVDDVLKRMSGIQTVFCPSPRTEGVGMDTVYSIVDGGSQLFVCFRAEPGLFRRLTENILGAPPGDEEEIREFAGEFFNVLCGRFLSEIYRDTQVRVRFSQPRYERFSAALSAQLAGPLERRYYLSERQELVEFSWSKALDEYTFGGTTEKMKHNIMVVDDSRVVHMEMKRLLEGSEFEIVTCCRSGEAALEEYEAANPELVTMDIVMPGMDGLETCKKLLEKWPDARIVMVSSLAYDATTEDSAAVGAKGFVYKPFTQEELLSGLRKALEG